MIDFSNKISNHNKITQFDLDMGRKFLQDILDGKIIVRDPLPIKKESVKPLSDAMGYQSPKHGYSAPKDGTGESK